MDVFRELNSGLKMEHNKLAKRYRCDEGMLQITREDCQECNSGPTHGLGHGAFGSGAARDAVLGNRGGVLEEKQLICAKGLGSPLERLEEIEETLAVYVDTVAEKLREQQSVCGAMQVFL